MGTKKKLPYCLAISVLAMSFPFFSVSAETRSCDSFKDTAVIDGADTGNEWNGVTAYPINRLKTGAETGIFSTFKTKWDESNLYVLISVTNDNTAQAVNGKWDRVSTYIDFDNCGGSDYSRKDYQFTIARNKDLTYEDCPAFAGSPAALTNNLQYEVISTADSYTIELKLNLKAITGEQMSPGKIIGFDVQVKDSAPDNAYGWNDDLDQAWQKVSALGKMTLKEKYKTGAATAISASQVPTIDGNIDGVWNAATTYNIDKYKVNGNGDTGTRGTFKLLWDGSSLYALIQVSDHTPPAQDEQNISKIDRVASYIDFDNCGSNQYGYKDYQFTVRRNNTYYSDDCPEFDLDNNLDYVLTATDTGYTIEYKLNLANISGETMTADKVIGFDIQIKDASDNSSGFGWNDDQDLAWKDLSALGKITLVMPETDNEDTTTAPDVSATTANSGKNSGTTDTNPATNPPANSTTASQGNPATKTTAKPVNSPATSDSFPLFLLLSAITSASIVSLILLQKKKANVQK